MMATGARRVAAEAPRALGWRWNTRQCSQRLFDKLDQWIAAATLVVMGACRSVEVRRRMERSQRALQGLGTASESVDAGIPGDIAGASLKDGVCEQVE